MADDVLKNIREVDANLQMFSDTLKRIVEVNKTYEDVQRNLNETVEENERSIDEIYKKKILIETSYTKKKLEEIKAVEGLVKSQKEQLRQLALEIAKKQELIEATDQNSEQHKLLVEQIETLRNEYSSLNNNIIQNQGKINQNTTALVKNQTSLGTFATKISDTAKETFTFKAGLAGLGASLKALSNELRQTTKQYGGFYEGLNQSTSSTGQFIDIVKQLGQTYYDSYVKYGINPETLARLNREYRQMSLVIGDTNKVQHLLNTTNKEGLTFQQQYFRLTGNNEQAMSALYEQLNMLAVSGIKPTSAALQSMADTTTRVSKITGIMPDQFNELMNSIIGTTESIGLMRAMSEQQRVAFLKTNQTILATNVALGMTKEQAAQAAKTLNEMAGQKPLDRMRQAARMRAMGAAFGVEGADVAAQAVIAGSRATDEQRQALAAFSRSMATTMDQMRGAGLGAEIVSTTMMEKMDLERYFGKESPFSTTLAIPVKQAAENLSTANADLTKGMDAFVKVMNALQSPIGALTGAIVVLTGAVVANTMAQTGKAIGNIGKGVGSAVGNAAKGAVGLAARGTALGLSGMAGYELGELFYGSDFGYTATQNLIDFFTGGPKADAATEARKNQMIQEMKQRRAEYVAGSKTPSTMVVEQTEETNKKIEQQNNIIDQNLNEIKQSNSYLKTISDMIAEQLLLTRKQIELSGLSEEERRKQINSMLRINEIKGKSASYITPIQ
jgi:predicted nuclease with TOPRIM domain